MLTALQRDGSPRQTQVSASLMQLEAQSLAKNAVVVLAEVSAKATASAACWYNHEASILLLCVCAHMEVQLRSTVWKYVTGSWRDSYGNCNTVGKCAKGDLYIREGGLLIKGYDIYLWMVPMKV